MNQRNIFGTTAMILGLLAAGASFAGETTTPAKVQERATYRNQEQNTEKQQKMAETRKEAGARDGSGEKHQHREMNREQTGSSEMRGNSGSRPR